MKTMRGFSVAVALTLVGAAPSAGQQPQHPRGDGHPTAQEGAPITMDHGTCMEMMQAMQMDAAPHHPAAAAQETPRARRWTRSSRLGAAAAASRMPRATAELPHAYRDGVRRATGPNRFPPAITGWHDAGLSAEASPPARPRTSPARRANGPTRIPRR
jgi:hypothetical protein